jgi:IS4 transposase
VVLPAILNPFAEGAPAAVMTRIALDWIIDSTPFDQLFHEVAESQYEREFALSHFVQVMLDVASGFRPSPRAAFLRREFQRVASISAFYRKLGRMELGITEDIVRRTAQRARQLIVASGGLLAEPVAGYAARILDGNVLAGTEHRIVPLRTTGSAGLPGMSLAVYEPASGLILDLILEENAQAQERALLDRVTVEPGQLWIMDRNFCVRSLLFRIEQAQAFFLVRWHRSTLPCRATSRLRSQGRCAAGRILAQTIAVEEGDGVVHSLRRIVLKLDEPTRDGETEIVLITNLPAEVTAVVCCDAYAGRWQIEGHYQTLTDLLHCEVPSLGHPRAALFAFSMSAVAGNALAVLKGNLRVAHGEEVAAEVSDFALVDEVAEVYPGMMVAVPPASWPRVAECDAAAVAGALNELAERVPVHRMFRCRRGPKKPRPKRSRGNRVHHVSNKKLLDRARGTRAPTHWGRSPSGVRN